MAVLYFSFFTFIMKFMDFLKPEKEIRKSKEIPLLTKEVSFERGKKELLEGKKERVPLLKIKRKAKTKEEVKPILEKSETVEKIEKILSEGLEDVYYSLPDSLKIEFKKKGEEIAFKIEKLISQVKIAVRKIVKLIKEWLKMIPGINRFFIEQESKIKTDKILKLAEEKRKKELKI